MYKVFAYIIHSTKYIIPLIAAVTGLPGGFYCGAPRRAFSSRSSGVISPSTPFAVSILNLQPKSICDKSLGGGNFLVYLQRLSGCFFPAELARPLKSLAAIIFAQPVIVHK